MSPDIISDIKMKSEFVQNWYCQIKGLQKNIRNWPQNSDEKKKNFFISISFLLNTTSVELPDSSV